ncbi:MAG: discoidin domain-containing protein, partial [Planctomycetota bacterium]
MMEMRYVPASLLVIVFGLVAAVPGADEVVTVKVHVDSHYQGYEGQRAMDGDPETMWHTDCQFYETRHPHEILFDLGAPYELAGFAYLPRQGGGNGTIGEYECYVGDDVEDLGVPVVAGSFTQRNAENVVTFPTKQKGRYLLLRALSEVNGRPWTSIAEFRPLADGIQFRGGSSVVDRPRGPIAPAPPESDVQFAVLQHDLGNRAHFDEAASETFRPEALIQPSDRDPADVVLRRAAALLSDLKRMHPAPELGEWEAELGRLQSESRKVDVADTAARRALFEEICRVRRRIAFSNPLLDFDQILFIKRHMPVYHHMCDQYYAITARPGGGLFVLSDPFGPQPQLRDVLADSVVERGRLEGQKLTGGSSIPPMLSYDGVGNLTGPDQEGGSFLSPDLSYDAKTVLFAFTECKGDKHHYHHTDPNRGHWHEGRCFHVFKVNVDGSGLEQLTDGTWNDFDPCWLPNGRVALITERRGGYLRCGRVCPTYTLYDMAADGSDMTALSVHETNEWHPSVTHDGRILYTRWDYVDRFGCTAHHPWITSLDGRDSRAVHGNFAPRQSRPDMELDCRAIPNSQKLVATAAPHHGQAFGSLVLVDLRVEDDDAMGPIKRITPDVGFPESQGGQQAYATAWPLGEDYYLCVYDAATACGAPGIRGNYGIYLVDSWGNKELIYRDPAIACQNPIPLKARRMPAAPPALVEPFRDAPGTGVPPGEPGKGTITVINTYDGLKPWPPGTKIQALRVLQLLPMTVPSGGLRPHETGARVALAGDSIVPVRYVLGTVPVEEDGSVHFTVPANRELFFQALDERGLAVQSMRSATYLQKGEHLVCMGCHERKHRAPLATTGTPLALRRPPSSIQPDVDGTAPFSYPRLVQPVLDRHCVTCHAEHPDKPI